MKERHDNASKKGNGAHGHRRRRTGSRHRKAFASIFTSPTQAPPHQWPQNSPRRPTSSHTLTKTSHKQSYLDPMPPLLAVGLRAVQHRRRSPPPPTTTSERPARSGRSRPRSGRGSCHRRLLWRFAWPARSPAAAVLAAARLGGGGGEGGLVAAAFVAHEPPWVGDARHHNQICNFANRNINITIR
uniref:Uncharacterized protein n=1 Tax=Oryza meridionalis TaxID=40149 RepID=A0A0E0CWW6_9ORYZ